MRNKCNDCVERLEKYIVATFFPNTFECLNLDILLTTSFATAINMYLFFVLAKKLKLIYIYRNPFICSLRPGSMVDVCLVQRLLDEQESDPLNVI